MTATAQRQHRDPAAHEGMPDQPVLPGFVGPGAWGEVPRAAAGIADAAAAETRAVGARMRCLHRLWLAAQAVRPAARFEALAQVEVGMSTHGFVRPDPLSPLAEAEHQPVVDAAAELEPAPDGTAPLHTLLDAHVAVAVHGRLENLTAHLGDDVPVPDRV